MRRKSAFRIFVSMVVIFAVLFSGCNQQPQVDADEAKEQLINKMQEQTNYSISGKTALRMNEEKEFTDIVEFTGFITQKENMFLDLNVVGFAGIPGEKIELAKISDKMKVRETEDAGWQEVSQVDLPMYNEFNTWNPEYIIKQITKIGGNAENIPSKNKLQGIKIPLDEAEVKKLLEQQLNSSIGGISEEEKNRMQEEMGLNDEDFQEFILSIEESSAEMKKMIAEMSETMRIEAFYELYYDPDSFLIAEITQKTSLTYQVDGESVSEDTLVSIGISDYGNEKKMPIS